MENITTSVELKKAIQLLEVEQYVIGQQLKGQLVSIYQGFKIINLLKSTVKEVVSLPNLFDSIIGAAMGLTTGYLSKKIFIGTSGNIIRKLFGFILQLGVTNTVAQHPDAVKSIGHRIFRQLLHKKQSPSES